MLSLPIIRSKVLSKDRAISKYRQMSLLQAINFSIHIGWVFDDNISDFKSFTFYLFDVIPECNFLIVWLLLNSAIICWLKFCFSCCKYITLHVFLWLPKISLILGKKFAANLFCLHFALGIKVLSPLKVVWGKNAQIYGICGSYSLPE